MRLDPVFLDYLDYVLQYRIDSPSESSSKSPFFISMEDFFKHMFVPHSGFEKALADKLKAYSSPILVLGPMGVGKTTLVYKTLHDALPEVGNHLVVIRCATRHQRYFESVESVATFVKGQLKQYVASQAKLSADELFANYLKAMYLQDVTGVDIEVSDAIEALSTEYERGLKRGIVTDLTFDEWIDMLNNGADPFLTGIIDRLKESSAASTWIDALSAHASSGGMPIVVFFDNVELLIDPERIEFAHKLLIRGNQIFGKKAFIVVTSRPRSYAASKVWQDAGTNNYDFINMLDYFSIRAFEDNNRLYSLRFETKRNKVKMTNTMHWLWLQNRIDFALTYTPCRDEKHLKQIMKSHRVAKRFSSFMADSPGVASVLYTLNNFSARLTFLVAIKWLSYLSKKNIISGSNSVPLRIRSQSLIHNKNLVTREMMMSLLYEFISEDGTGIDSIEKFKISVGGLILSMRSRRDGIPPEILDFIILRRLSGGVPDREWVGVPPSVCVSDIVDDLVLMGFSKQDVLSTIDELLAVDRYQMTCVERTKIEDALSDCIGMQDHISITPRSWMLSGPIIRRLHYWLNSISSNRVYYRRQPVMRSDNEKLSLRECLCAIAAVVEFAEVESRLIGNIASRVEGHQQSAHSIYARIVHAKSGALLAHSILHSFAHYLGSRIEPIDELETLIGPELAGIREYDERIQIGGIIGDVLDAIFELSHRMLIDSDLRSRGFLNSPRMHFFNEMLDKHVARHGVAVVEQPANQASE